MMQEIHIADYDYELPQERIAKYPLQQRDASRLLVYEQGQMSDATFAQLAEFLPSCSLAVFNNTRVIQARLLFTKSTGANIELFLLEPAEPKDYEQNFQMRQRCEWFCLVGNLKKWKGEPLSLTAEVGGNRPVTVRAIYKEALKTSHLIAFEWDDENYTFADIIQSIGVIPLPPYLNRAAQEEDKLTYQTIYSKINGSVAAPTAGLHFTPDVLHSLDEKGITRQELTLHVGAGTFRPVKSSEIHAHEMHSEYISIDRQLIENLLKTTPLRLAVGTTSVRTLESLYYIGAKLKDNPSLDLNDLHVAQWEPYTAHYTLTCEEALESLLRYMDAKHIDSLHTTTQIIIVPGYRYKLVDALVTNFHQPKSTLLLLVSAFIGDDWRRVYQHALEHDYRFLSYGDACLFVPSPPRL